MIFYRRQAPIFDRFVCVVVILINLRILFAQSNLYIEGIIFILFCFGFEQKVTMKNGCGPQ